MSQYDFGQERASRAERWRARCWVLRDRRPPGTGAAVSSDFGSVDRKVGRLECRPYVENYTVDASIFESRRGAGFWSVRLR